MPLAETADVSVAEAVKFWALVMVPVIADRARLAPTVPVPPKDTIHGGTAYPAGATADRVALKVALIVAGPTFTPVAGKLAVQHGEIHAS
jgi:hypothetical protein